MDDASFCRRLPKIELHAHVNGSISDATFRRILERRHLHLQTQHVWGDMADCFSMFKTIHDVVDNVTDVYTVVHDVIHDFADDGVRYLELRSTPRDVEATGMTKLLHVETMCRAIEDCNQSLNCVTRLLLSVDRGVDVQSAEENVDLAIKFKASGLVVGVDLSGNPTRNDASMFFPQLQRARDNGLKVAMHLCEVPDQDEEAEKLLSLKPDRIGHGTFLHGQSGGKAENEARVLREKTPLELCLTSNIKTKTTPTYADHHLKFWLDEGHPFVLGTDDKGIFRTCLSNEYALAMQHLDMDRAKIMKMIMDSVEFIFEGEDVKKKLRDEFREVFRGIGVKC